MSKAVKPKKAPVFKPYDDDLQLADLINPDDIRSQLTALTKEIGGDGSSTKIRAQVLSILKDTISASRETAEAKLFEDGKGVTCAQRLSAVQDELIAIITDFALTHVYRVKNLSEAERISIVAVGGYGRALLAPASDIDLLFVLPYKQTALGEQVVEYILYMLWDLGFKVGHATRSVDETIRQAKDDMTIRTSLVEARLVYGNAPLFDEMEERFYKEVTQNTAAEFIAAKLEERDQRHIKIGESRYLVEPNVKEGKGALRDLHTLFWIGKYVYHVKRGRELVAEGVYTRAEHNTFMKAQKFLWTVRCHLHFLTGAAEERLSFDVQTEMASRLGYTNHGGLRGVERFMKHFFLVAKDVGNLTRIFCSALEEGQKKGVTGRSLLRRFRKAKPKPIGKLGIFVNENGRINIALDDAFEDPINTLRLFAVADKKGLDYHPNALRALSRNLKRIDNAARQNPDINALFVEIVSKSRDPENTLRYMNEAGVLGRFIPEFRKIVSMMQFNMYHSYTVDEHLVRTVGVMADIESGKIADEHPLARKLLPNMPERTLLCVTLLLHDIAKGRPEDHSIAGGKIARKLCPRLGFSAAQTELCAWLIEEHLTMSTIAQSRDLSDQRTISDFAKIVQTRERLKLLVVLTICDIRAVGPNVWNGWKGQLLRTLYYETEIYLAGGFSKERQSSRIDHLRASLVAALDDWPVEMAERYATLHYSPFLQSNDMEEIVALTRFLARADDEQTSFSSSISCKEFEAITQVTVLTQDHPRLLSIIAQACAASGGNIVDAKVYTTRDGRALNSIFINREFPDDDAERRRAERMAVLIQETLAGDRKLPDLIAKRRKKNTRHSAFDIAPIVRLSNDLSDTFTVIEMEGLDRLGLLGQLTGALADLNLNIASARVSTFGEKVIDTFYVTDLIGHRIENPQRMAHIRKVLKSVLVEQGQSKTGKAA